jgi:zinc transporter
MDQVDTSFGSDQYGLVWGYLFAEGEASRPVDCAAAATFLRDDGALGRSRGFLWLHFSLSNAAAERWFRQHLSLPDAFHAALHEGVGATGWNDGDALVAVLHDALRFPPIRRRYRPSASRAATGDDQRRPRPLRSLDRLRATVRSSEAFGSPVELLLTSSRTRPT